MPCERAVTRVRQARCEPGRGNRRSIDSRKCLPSLSASFSACRRRLSCYLVWRRHAPPRPARPSALRSCSTTWRTRRGWCFGFMMDREASTTCPRSWGAAWPFLTPTATVGSTFISATAARSGRAGIRATLPAGCFATWAGCDSRMSQASPALRGRATRWALSSAITTATAGSTCSSPAGAASGSIATWAIAGSRTSRLRRDWNRTAGALRRPLPTSTATAISTSTSRHIWITTRPWPRTARPRTAAAITAGPRIFPPSQTCSIGITATARSPTWRRRPELINPPGAGWACSSPSSRATRVPTSSSPTTARRAGFTPIRETSSFARRPWNRASPTPRPAQPSRVWGSPLAT